VSSAYYVNTWNVKDYLAIYLFRLEKIQIYFKEARSKVKKWVGFSIGKDSCFLSWKSFFFFLTIRLKRSTDFIIV